MGLGIAAAFAGGLGTLARYGVQAFLAHHTAWPVPASTFAINTLGSLLLGYVLARFGASEWARLVVGLGLLGGFTTFSTLASELYRLIDGRAYPLAFAYGAGTVLAGLVAVYVGVVPRHGVGRVLGSFGLMVW